MQYWLMKSEPTAFSIDNLASQPSQTTFWDGVRNYQARNMLRDQMKKGDLAFFYHSSCAEPGIVGIMKVASASSPDPSQFDGSSHHFDADSNPQSPRWYGVEVQLIEKFSQIIGLPALRQSSALSQMLVLRKGNRLSITPVTAPEWQAVLKLRER